MLKKYLLMFFLFSGILLITGNEANAQAKKGEKHPKVDWDLSCQDCHADVTPEIFKQWEDSKHGGANFGCYICHGDGQEVFYKKGKDDRCEGCHSSQQETMVKTKIKSCFTCHQGHTLKFHN